MVFAEVEKLRQWLTVNELQVVLFDLDDTLLATHRIFDEKINTLITWAATELPEYSFENLLRMFREINEQAFVTHAVNPNRWELVTTLLGEKCGGKAKDVFHDGLEVLMEIYRVVPPILPGALEVLSLFERTGVSMGLVTHANQDWTDFKLDNTGLRPFFENILVVDENRHKSSQDWVHAAKLFRSRSDQGMVVGDNLRGDVIAATEAGFRKVVWIDEKDNWSVYRQGNIPEGVIVVPEIAMLTQALLGMK